MLYASSDKKKFFETEAECLEYEANINKAAEEKAKAKKEVEAAKKKYDDAYTEYIKLKRQYDKMYLGCDEDSTLVSLLSILGL